MSITQNAVCKIAVLTVALVAPSVAGAAVHSGRAIFPEPGNPPSIGVPPPSADQTREYDREVVIHYDASVGSVTLSAEVWDPVYWGEKYGETFSIGSKCKEGPLSLFGPSDFEGHIQAQPRERGLGGTERGGVVGKATLRGYTGQVEATGVFNGKRFEITFRSSAFRNRNWRCAEVHEPANKPTTFRLNHWPKPKPKARHAGSLIRQVLAPVRRPVAALEQVFGRSIQLKYVEVEEQR
jgi:hypothetical protein